MSLLLTLMLAFYHEPWALILAVVLIVLLIPAWPYSTGWGYGPSGGLLLLIVIVLLLAGCSGQMMGPGTLTYEDQSGHKVSTNYGGSKPIAGGK
jgi:hypothetical protein